MRSMTGYATHSCVVGDVAVTFEVKAVNHRYLDVFVKAPACLAAYEHDFRKIVQEVLVRGKVSLFVSIDDSVQTTVELNESIVKGAVRSLKKVKKDFGLHGEISVSDIVRIPSVFSSKSKVALPAKVIKGMKEGLVTVLDMFVAVREKEGRALEKDIVKRVSTVEKYRKHILKIKGDVNKKLHDRYEERLAALTDTTVDEERIAREIAVMLEKADITEEVVRLETHLTLFRDVVDSDVRECGKKLDFVVQEMNREVNTIASKAQNSDIVHSVVAMKSEIEKIREQIQNIE